MVDDTICYNVLLVLVHSLQFAPHYITGMC